MKRENSDRSWPSFPRDATRVRVRLGDIVPHEVPDPGVVAAIAEHIRGGGEVEPIEISPEWREHWTQGPREMESIGVGFGLLDGHHRFAALVQVFGVDHVVDAALPAAKTLSHRPG